VRPAARTTSDSALVRGTLVAEERPVVERPLEREAIVGPTAGEVRARTERRLLAGRTATGPPPA
jgi:hypothetical protein